MTTVISDPGNIQEFNYSVNILQALLWQYQNASNLLGLLEQKQTWYDTNQTEFWESWITNVFDLRTANEFGLQVWSIILDFPLYVNSEPSEAAFGFASDSLNFYNGNFGDSGGTYALPLEIQRIALQLRYTQLTSSGTVPEINRALAWIFADFGQAYLIDNHNMTQTYIFNFPVTFDLQYLFNNYDILPRPAAVASTWLDNTIPYFGFSPESTNFYNGNFFGGTS